jgi:SNF2 family DNA or RNA helicase
VWKVCRTDDRLDGARYFRYTGSMNKKERDAAIENFTNCNEPAVFLCTTAAGGCGINLVPCSVVFLCDVENNPFLSVQAINRVHRITQKHTVHLFRFFAFNLLENRILRENITKIKLTALNNIEINHDIKDGMLECLSKLEIPPEVARRDAAIAKPPNLLQ